MPIINVIKSISKESLKTESFEDIPENMDVFPRV